MLGMDLRAEPLVISVPAVEKKRYYSVQLVDSNTFIFGYIGSRATGIEPGNYLVVGPDWKGDAPAGIKQVFRSFSSAGVPASKDTAPQAQVVGLDFDKMKAEYAMLGASLNGPKLWMPDWTEVDVGAEREFNGIKTAWVAQLNIDSNKGVSDSQAYESATIARKSGVGWNKARRSCCWTTRRAIRG
jgi:hypothetical protein